MTDDTTAGLDFNHVQLTDVSRHFGRRRAVSRVSLSLASGDILGLLGPNGAGKSTLMGMLATLVGPTTGTIVYGDNIPNGAGLRRRIGLLAHELHLYPELSARENLAFFAQLYDLDAAVVVPNALERAGLTGRADDNVSTFSRGMRQRLALERALMHAPRLVLLDEPFTGLDDSAVRLVADRIRGLAASGAMVVLATHDLDVADGLVTRVVVIQGGRLLSDEPADGALRSRYRHLTTPTTERESLRSSERQSEEAAGSGVGAPRP